MIINKEKLDIKLEKFDVSSDYYIAVIPDDESIDEIKSILDDQDSFIKKNKLEPRTVDYLHMTVIYLPSINKLNRELYKINPFSRIGKKDMIGFIAKLLDNNYEDEKYEVNKVGCLGKRSVSLWMSGNTLPIFDDAIVEFKKLIIDSGLSQDEFNIFVQNAGFSVLGYYKDLKFLPHISVIKVPDNTGVSNDFLQELTKLFKNMRIKVNKIELRKNSTSN